MAYIKIKTEKCKGCGLCVGVCPDNAIKLSEKFNEKGYSYIVYEGEKCRGCKMCVLMCPDCVIEVFEDDK
ncbi:MAG: 4Fe-4S binding protein [Candidatus Aureabacteria bacterium]|nr:4Fe-4S binding protein [Candidatus Auribacterota bacterium]MCK5160412.1 4Fe-4S binding protein [Candidatus Auribacterota bacterium]